MWCICNARSANCLVLGCFPEIRFCFCGLQQPTQPFGPPLVAATLSFYPERSPHRIMITEISVANRDRGTWTEVGPTKGPVSAQQTQRVFLRVLLLKATRIWTSPAVSDEKRD